MKIVFEPGDVIGTTGGNFGLVITPNQALMVNKPSSRDKEYSISSIEINAPGVNAGYTNIGMFDFQQKIEDEHVKSMIRAMQRTLSTIQSYESFHKK